MIYEIKDRDSKYFLPTVEQWIRSTFKFSILAANLYKLISIKGYRTWTWAYYSMILGVSQRTVGRMLKNFADREIIKQYTVTISGTKTRTINIALYTKDGLISPKTLEAYRAQGYAEIMAMETKDSSLWQNVTGWAYDKMSV